LSHHDELKNIILSGGDDYEILLCASEDNGRDFINNCKKIGIQVTKIGRVVSGNCEVNVLDGYGKPMKFKKKGWEHF